MDNTVELLGHYGNDETIAGSAWTSTSRDLSDEKKSRIDKLLKMLAENGHETPFEKSSLHFLVTTDIATHIHLLKHRIGVSCLSGDNFVQFLNSNLEITPKLKISINDLWKKWNNGRPHQNTVKDLEYTRNRIKKMKIELYDEEKKEVSFGHIKNIFYMGNKEVFKYITGKGNEIYSTIDHKVLTESGWQEIDYCYENGIKIAHKEYTNSTKDIEFKIPEFDYRYEEWVPILNEVGYEVSNLGRIRSFWNNRYLQNNKPPKIKKQTMTPQGYFVVNLSNKTYLVSRLVLKSFKPINNFATMQVRHLDGNPFNNSIFNLDWGTDKENKDDNLINRDGYSKNRIKFYKIVSKHFIKEDAVYDLEIDNKNHNFTCNGIIVHNCNAESARYKELRDDKFYIPIDWEEEEVLEYIEFFELALSKYHKCLKRLKEKGFTAKRAKETARFYLPYGNQITADVMFNWRSFYHFQKLRNSEHAQVEVRQVAKQMLQLVKDIEGNPFKHTIEAFKL